MSRDDLALQRMALDIRAELFLERRWKVTRERSTDPGVFGQIGREQLVEQPHLRVREQHRALRTCERNAFGAALIDFVVAGQKLDRAIQHAPLFEKAHKALLMVEQQRSNAAGDGQRLALKVVVAQYQRSDVV